MALPPTTTTTATTMTTATIEKPAGIATGLPDVGCYIACLASYNNGILHGAWVDLELATLTEEVQECIDWILATSPTAGAEEYAVHDWSGVPSSIRSQEWPDWEQVLNILDAIDNHGAAFTVWHDYAPDYNTDPSDFEAAYVGEYESGEDFAYDYYQERKAEALADLEELTFAIDWEAVWERGNISQEFWGAMGSDDRFHVFFSC